MKSTSCIHGISSYIKKVEAIADQCGCGEKKAAIVETKDEFILTKMRMYMLIEDIRTGVQERSALMKRRGICSETITKGHEHRQKLTELQSLQPKLHQIHKKAGKNKKTNSNDARSQENTMRYQDMRVIRLHVESTRDLVEGQAQDEDTAPSSQMLGLGLRDAANARGDPNTQRPFTEEEQQVLSDMRGRDKQIDQQVGEIGCIVERMVPIAQQIGFTAEKQKDQADKIATQVEKNTEEIDRQGEATKALIKYEKSTTQCCQMVLGLILLCVVGFICHQMGIGS